MILLNNILENANKYAFDEKSNTNELFIDLREVDDHLSIEIKNNGKPFPNNFDKDKFITKYSTAHSEKGTGLGGYDINRIATYFENDDWVLDLNNDPLFPVIFRFKLPLKIIK